VLKKAIGKGTEKEVPADVQPSLAGEHQPGLLTKAAVVGSQLASRTVDAVQYAAARMTGRQETGGQLFVWRTACLSFQADSRGDVCCCCAAGSAPEQQSAEKRLQDLHSSIVEMEAERFRDVAPGSNQLDM
jgi:hypothetical protein